MKAASLPEDLVEVGPDGAVRPRVRERVAATTAGGEVKMGLAVRRVAARRCGPPPAAGVAAAAGLLRSPSQAVNFAVLFEGRAVERIIEWPSPHSSAQTTG